MTVVDNHLAWIRGHIETLLDQLFKLTASGSPEEETERLRAEVAYLQGLLDHYQVKREPDEGEAAAKELAGHMERVVDVLRRSAS